MEPKKGNSFNVKLLLVLYLLYKIVSVVDAQCSTCTGTCNNCQGCGSGGNTTTPAFTCETQTQLEQFLEYCDSICMTNPSVCGLTLESPCEDLVNYCYSFGGTNIFLNTTTFDCALERVGGSTVGSCNFAFLVTSCCNSLPTPIAPPVTPPVEPPVQPPVSSTLYLDCTANNTLEAVDLLVDCQADCPGCSTCAQVYAYCVQFGFLNANYTIGGCLSGGLDNIPTANGTCPFDTTLNDCCGTTPVPPVAPPVEPPVTPPVAPVIPVVDCVNNTAIEQVLNFCAQECGPSCTVCGQVYTFCSDEGYLIGNFTTDYCLVTTLNGEPVVNDTCDFITALDTCCFGPPTPVSPPVEPPLAPVENCTLISDLTASFGVCSTLCSFTGTCTSCDQVYSLCVGLGLFDASLEYSACLLEQLANQSTSGVCSFESALQFCCTEQPSPVASPIIDPPTAVLLPQDVACDNIFEADAAFVQCLAYCLENTGCGYVNCQQLYLYCLQGPDPFITTLNITFSTCVEFELTTQFLPLCQLSVAMGECCGAVGVLHHGMNRLDQEQQTPSKDDNGTSLFNISITIVGYNINMLNLIFIVFCFVTALVILSCALKYGIRFAIRIMTQDEKIKRKMMKRATDYEEEEEGERVEYDTESKPLIHKKSL